MGIGEAFAQGYARFRNYVRSAFHALSEADAEDIVQQVAEAAGFSVVREYVGHGIGRAMHEEPSVPNVGWPGRGTKLRSGNVLALEPMVAVGTPDTEVLDDDWTVVTLDGSYAAHWEHTVAATDTGPRILTPRR